VIPAGKPFGVLRKGRIWVSSDAAFVVGTTTAHVRFTANGATKQPGMITDTTDSAKADVLDGSGYLVRHRVIESADANTPVPIEINLPS
jgi:hypothetical protein